MSAQRSARMRITAGRWPGLPTRYGSGSGVEYTLAGLDVLLHRIGWSVQVPARRAAEQDEDRIARWREETWPVIKGRWRDLDAWLCFGDESGRKDAPGAAVAIPRSAGDRRPQQESVAGRADRHPARLPGPADLPHRHRPQAWQ